MNSAKATKIKDGYYRLQENAEMKELNKLLGIDWKKGIVKLEELNNGESFENLETRLEKHFNEINLEDID